MDGQRLSKVLAAAGVASRRACEEIIFSGRVKVNGEVVLLPQYPVDPTRDEILVDGEVIRPGENRVYYLLNKPKGFVCSHNRELHSRVVFDLFPQSHGRLFSAGRLDKATTGLLIVTNDSHYANRIIHPSAHIEKEYVAKTSEEIEASHLAAIAKGTHVEGRFVKPVRVTKIRRGTVKVVVMEGKKHEVRILLKRVGLHVRELTRIRLGGLLLGTLPEGKWREMSLKERELILKKN